MKCLKCMEQIVPITTFKNIFKKRYQLLCNKCQKELVYGYYHEIIPINSGKIIHYFIKYNEIDSNYEIDQFLLEPLYQEALRLKLPTFYFDKINDEIYHILDNLIWGDLLVITIS